MSKVYKYCLDIDCIIVKAFFFLVSNASSSSGSSADIRSRCLTKKSNYCIILDNRYIVGVDFKMRRSIDLLYKCFLTTEFLCISGACLALLISLSITILESHELLLIGFYLVFCIICISVTYFMRSILQKAKLIIRITCFFICYFFISFRTIDIFDKWL